MFCAGAVVECLSLLKCDLILSSTTGRCLLACCDILMRILKSSNINVSILL